MSCVIPIAVFGTETWWPGRTRKKIIQDAKVIIEEKTQGKQIAGKIDGCGSSTVRSGPRIRVYSICHKPGYNARTCEKDQEISNKYGNTLDHRALFLLHNAARYPLALFLYVWNLFSVPISSQNSEMRMFRVSFMKAMLTKSKTMV